MASGMDFDSGRERRSGFQRLQKQIEWCVGAFIEPSHRLPHPHTSSAWRALSGYRHERIASVIITSPPPHSCLGHITSGRFPREDMCHGPWTLRGEDLELVSRSLGVTAAALTNWITASKRVSAAGLPILSCCRDAGPCVGGGTAGEAAGTADPKRRRVMQDYRLTAYDAGALVAEGADPRCQ